MEKQQSQRTHTQLSHCIQPDQWVVAASLATPTTEMHQSVSGVMNRAT